MTAPKTAGDDVRDVLVQRSWNYDAAGRVRAISDQRWGRTLYDYDDLGQLIQARRGKLREVFDYDAIGSLRGVLETLDQRENAIPWGIATGNVLHATKDAEFTNDKNHRRRTKRDRTTGALTEYLWDCRDRLREVRLPDGNRALYTYDAFGRRVRKEIVPKQTVEDLASVRVPEVRVVEFLWDGNALAAEYDSERGARVHVHEPGSLVPALQAEQGEVFVVVNDHLGMPKELLGQDGKIAWSAAHAAWGRVVESEGRSERPVESPFRLVGQYADAETGLCYARFRYFDAQHGRWLSPDPLGIVGGKNLFAFDGAPTTDADSLGLACKKTTLLDAEGNVLATGGSGSGRTHAPAVQEALNGIEQDRRRLHSPGDCAEPSALTNLLNKPGNREKPPDEALGQIAQIVTREKNHSGPIVAPCPYCDEMLARMGLLDKVIRP